MLDLLQNWIRQAVNIGVTRDQQHRQAISVSHACSRYHVGGAGTHRGGGNHNLTPLFRFAVSNSG